MPPPLLPLTALLSASPPVIVRRSIVTLPPLTSKTRDALLPLTVNRLAPGPLIVRASVMLSSLARGMVPFNPGATVTEQGWRWCRRNPTVAALGTALLVLVLVSAVGGVLL